VHHTARARAQPPPPPRLGRAPGSNEPNGPRRRKQGRGPHRSRSEVLLRPCSEVLLRPCSEVLLRRGGLYTARAQENLRASPPREGGSFNYGSSLPLPCSRARGGAASQPRGKTPPHTHTTTNPPLQCQFPGWGVALRKTHNLLYSWMAIDAVHALLTSLAGGYVHNHVRLPVGCGPFRRGTKTCRRL
jgi:hypothetical protein